MINEIDGNSACFSIFDRSYFTQLIPNTRLENYLFRISITRSQLYDDSFNRHFAQSIPSYVSFLYKHYSVSMYNILWEMITYWDDILILHNLPPDKWFFFCITFLKCYLQLLIGVHDYWFRRERHLTQSPSNWIGQQLSPCPWGRAPYILSALSCANGYGWLWKYPIG